MQPPALSPAQDAFLACIRLYFRDSGAAARLQESTHKLDWDDLIALASYHGVIPLVRASLLQSETAIPKRARQQLDEDFSACAALSLLYARELARLPFRANGIPALALKGPPLAIQLYEKASLRQCRDLDLLIPKSELPRAMAVLKASGYRLDDSYAGRDDALETDKHLLFIEEDNGAKLELHWAITLPARHIHLDFETLWSRRDEVSVFGTPVAVPGRSDLPLILSVHGSSHYWTSLKWVCDIAALLQRHPNLDWECVRKQAAIAGCGRVLLVAIALANQLTAVPVPPTLEGSIQKDPTVGLLAREGHCRILAIATPTEPMRAAEPRIALRFLQLHREGESAVNQEGLASCPEEMQKVAAICRAAAIWSAGILVPTVRRGDGPCGPLGAGDLAFQTRARLVLRAYLLPVLLAGLTEAGGQLFGRLLRKVSWADFGMAKLLTYTHTRPPAEVWRGWPPPGIANMCATCAPGLVASSTRAAWPGTGDSLAQWGNWRLRELRWVDIDGIGVVVLSNCAQPAAPARVCKCSMHFVRHE